jgi:uncharacterized membrane protein
MIQDPETRRAGAAGSLAAALGAALWAALLVLVLRLPLDGREHGDLWQFMGRVHPLLVHGPAAFLVLVPLLELAGLFGGRPHLRMAAAWILALTAACALVAAYAGWLLAWGGGLRGHDITRHMWGGVWLAAACILAAWLRHAPVARVPKASYPALLACTVGLMVWTAHGGGSITHGEGFLTDKMPPRLRQWLGMAPAAQPVVAAAAPRAAPKGGPASADPANPAFYGLHVAPILNRSCFPCHRPEKHKSGFRLDSYEQLMRGGDNGPAVLPGNPGKSDLLRRVKLPAADDDYMPSDGERPLTAEEIQTLERWIGAGAKGG